MRVLIIYIYIYLHTHTHHGVTASIDLGVFIIETSRSHSDTPYSVGLLWATDQPHAETSTWQHTTLTRDRYPWPWRDSNAQSQERAAADPRLRRRDHWDRPIINITTRKPYVDEHFHITCTWRTRIETSATLAQTPISIEWITVWEDDKACQKFCWVTPVNRFFCPGSLHEEGDRASLWNYVRIPLNTNNFYLKLYVSVFTQTCHKILPESLILFDILIICFFCDNCSVVSRSTRRSSNVLLRSL